MQHNSCSIITPYDSPEYIAYEKQHIEKSLSDFHANFDRCAFMIKRCMLHTDLVAFHDYGTGCCEVCAAHIGRVYSVSGKNKNFPKLPDYVKKHGNFHPGCRCSMSAFFDDGYLYVKGKRTSPLPSSARPFVDDRTAREVELYQEHLDRIQSNAKAEASREFDRVEYEQLLALFPSNTPKTFGAYRRMKSSNTAGFQKLVKLTSSVIERSK